LVVGAKLPIELVVVAFILKLLPRASCAAVVFQVEIIRSWRE